MSKIFYFISNINKNQLPLWGNNVPCPIYWLELKIDYGDIIAKLSCDDAIIWNNYSYYELRKSFEEKDLNCEIANKVMEEIINTDLVDEDGNVIQELDAPRMARFYAEEARYIIVKSK